MRHTEIAVETLDLAGHHIGDAENLSAPLADRALSAAVAQARALTAIGVLLGVIAEHLSLPALQSVKADSFIDRSHLFER